MLLGRVDDVERIEGMLRRAAQERASGALIVHGDAGVGKTTLLEHVVREASQGFTVLRSHPIEAEAELPFTGLFDLLRPIHALLHELAEPQRAALSSGLALGPAVPGDRFAVGAATLSLLAAAADDHAPVLAVVDDAHWLDTPSRDAMLFAGRRLASEGVVLLLAMRDREWLHDTAIETLELRGLGPEDASALVDGTGAVVDPGVRRRLVDEAHGNPLALLAAIERLSDEQLRGTRPIVGPVAVGPALREAFAQHLGALPADTQSALLIAAASGTGLMDEIVGALDVSGLERATLEPAEEAGLITVNARLEFRHPLIRSAAYHRHNGFERRAAHRALATTLGVGVRSAWHLAAASEGPDERVAAELEAAGDTAFSRSAYAAAASAYEAAAGLSPADSHRLRRTIAAGRALWLSGQASRAAALLESVLELATEPTVRADLQHLRGAATLFTRPVAENYLVLVSEAERVEPYDGARAAALFATAGIVCVTFGEFEKSADCAKRAAAAAEPGSDFATIIAPTILAVALASLGEVESTRPQFASLVDRLLLIEPLSEHFIVCSTLAWILQWSEEWGLAERLIERNVAVARAAGAPSVLPLPLAMLGELELRRGRLAAAYGAATESVQLAEETGQTVASAHALLTLARVEALLGYETGCREHVAIAVELSRRTGARAIESFGAGPLGLMALSNDRPERVVEELIDASPLVQGVHATFVQWAGDLGEASARLGETEEATRAIARLEALADQTGLRWPRAAAMRCRGLLAQDDFEPEFAAAIELFGADMAFERARTQLALGRRRAHAQRPADARSALNPALDYFESAGAEPWAEQARAELEATGETPIRRDRSLRELTPQELQVTLFVAKGTTDREAAASLFLSERTVEFHLANACRKLGLRSRAELVERAKRL